MLTVSRNDQIMDVVITSEMRSLIDTRTKDVGVLNSRTLVGGEGNRSGTAGELIVHAAFPFLRHDNDNPNWDFVDVGSGVKIDVKSKGNSYRPKIEFDCTIPEYQDFQSCDIYIFTRVSKDESVGWINGWIPKKLFLEKATVRERGTDYNNAGRRSVGNHKVVLVSDLFPIDTLSAALQRMKAIREQSAD